jgi:uncharacterized protein (TIGR02594 family)
MLLKRGETGNQVRELQKLLRDEWDYQVGVDGVFGPQTEKAVRQFQSTHHDEHGAPLVVDGKVGPVTWKALRHRSRPAPIVPPMEGGSKCGRKALGVARQEMAAGAREVGGNNSGPWVKKYLGGAGLDEGNPWCASFVSWCFFHACGDNKSKMPFPYNPLARGVFSACKAKGWQVGDPKPGDLIVWWRESLHSGKGHIGFVESVKDGFVYTIEGNKSDRVQQFQYVLGRIDRLIGFIRIPDAAC